MKKAIGMILAVCMLLGMTACSSSGSSANGSGANKAEKYPENTVSIICNLSAGGGSDMLTRLVAQHLTEATGETFTVENVDGGNMITGAETVFQSDPDGYTLLATNLGFIIRMITGVAPYTFDDFTTISFYTSPSKEGYCIVVPADSPFETLEDYVTYAKAHPGEVMCASQAGGYKIFLDALLCQEFDIQTNLVDVGADSKAILELLGGTADVATVSIISAKQYIESGDLRVLTVLNKERSDVFPDAAILSDFGYSSENVDIANLMLLLGPKDMDQSVVDKINEYLDQVCAEQSLQDSYAQMNVEWNHTSQEETKEYLQDLYEKMTGIYDTVHAMGLA